MTRPRTVLIACLLAGAVGLPAIVRAQEPPVVRLGQDYTLGAGNTVREVVVIAGTATIEGRVESNVVVVFGQARLASTASIGGDFVVVGGSAVVSPGAQVGHDLVIVGGTFDPPAGFAPGGEQVVIGSAAVGSGLRAVGPWITRGLFWGRPLVPDLPWVWSIVAIFFLVYLALNVVLNEPVRACADTLAEKPLTTFLAGLLVLLLAGPVSLLLVVSIIGVVVVPFVHCAIFLAWIIGKVGVARWIGRSLVREESPDNKAQALRSFTLGFAIVMVAYMIPILGFVAWTMVGVFGLGAATLAFIAGYRREHPAPPLLAPSVGLPLASEADRSSALPLAGDTDGALNPPTAAPLAAPDLASFPRAAFMERLGAFALDTILVLITAPWLRGLFGRGSGEEAVFLLLLAYHIGFWAWKGTTVGGIICQLRVVRVDGTPLRFVDALVRGLSSIFSFAVLGLGCLWILKDPERQSWHDKIAGTYVVKVPRNWPL
jgi:uncharacterized RDD family membrane protein YckC